MPKVKCTDLKIGDVVEFTPNGWHHHITGTVFKNDRGGLSIQCENLVVGVGKDADSSRNYKLLSSKINNEQPK